MHIWSFITRLLLPALVVLLLGTITVVQAQSPENSATAEPVLGYDEAEAYSIDGMIMCPVCPAETIDQAQVPIARQMRQIVRNMLGQGSTREEILDFFAQRYGQDILAAPPKSGLNLVAWIFPMVAVSAALITGVLVLRSMTSKRAGEPVAVPPMPQEDDALAPYLEMVDRQLALGGTAREPGDNTQPDGGAAPASEFGLGNVEPHREGGPYHHG